MNEGIHLDLDTWIVPGQIRKANLYFIKYIGIYRDHDDDDDIGIGIGIDRDR